MFSEPTGVCIPALILAMPIWGLFDFPAPEQTGASTRAIAAASPIPIPPTDILLCLRDRILVTSMHASMAKRQEEGADTATQRISCFEPGASPKVLPLPTRRKGCASLLSRPAPKTKKSSTLPRFVRLKNALLLQDNCYYCCRSRRLQRLCACRRPQHCYACSCSSHGRKDQRVYRA